MALYRFVADQEHVITGLQTEDGATLVCQPADLIDTVNLDDSLKAFFEPAGGAKKADARKAVAVAGAKPSPAGPPAETPPPASASETEEKK